MPQGATAPPHQEEPSEVAMVSITGDPYMPCSGDFPGMSHLEEILRKSQDIVTMPLS